MGSESFQAVKKKCSKIIKEEAPIGTFVNKTQPRTSQNKTLVFSTLKLVYLFPYYICISELYKTIYKTIRPRNCRNDLITILDLAVI